jgi:hypothetical protein
VLCLRSSAVHRSARSILMRNQQSPFYLVGFVPLVFGLLLFLVANFHSLLGLRSSTAVVHLQSAQLLTCRNLSPVRFRYFPSRSGVARAAWDFHCLGFPVAAAYAPPGTRFLCLCSVRCWVKSLFCAIVFPATVFCFSRRCSLSWARFPLEPERWQIFGRHSTGAFPDQFDLFFPLHQFGPPVSRSLVAAGLGAGKDSARRSQALDFVGKLVMFLSHRIQDSSFLVSCRAFTVNHFLCMEGVR